MFHDLEYNTLLRQEDGGESTESVLPCQLQNPVLMESIAEFFPRLGTFS